MFFDAFSSVNITKVLSDYLLLVSESVRRQFASPASPSAPSAGQPRNEAGESEPESFELNILTTGWCFVCETLQFVKRALDGARWLHFTEFQLLLLQIFSTLLLALSVCIAVSWRKYGNRITNRFIRPSTAKEIEELKLSVARLNLPKEHTPRI
ncbi:uncharacterized protein LOC128277643 [Anopheles cruzii]|uniref:uncharacterized protein LOC128277643 n=1 Tax=Anopheles cruzii TaxID=68878 RepID=UPI0022EC1760|nr:uncharacterized protein LOC128277643 [Anopheles cruzii]